ncbi:hypothetical protein [Streptomyces sp. NPDC048644]|uniref:hypothetical protein n=1 Tax=Streptomyces sp. NPDC048644 TaxID=3365582 RepID=UPI0037147626
MRENADMLTRRLLAAAALAAALATLTSCKSDDATASPGASASSAASEPAASSEPSKASGPSASAPESGDKPVDPEPSFDCTPRKIPAGHRMVQVTAASSGGALSVREAEFACDPNGGGYAGTGKAAHYQLAAGATVELSAGATAYRTVPTAELAGHLTACLKHRPVEPPLSCAGNIYELTVNGSGDVSHVREVWHA